MRLSWVIQVCHKYNHMCFCKREEDGELMTQRQNRRSQRDHRDRVERFSCKPRDAGSYQKLEEECISNVGCPANNYWFTIHLQ